MFRPTVARSIAAPVRGAALQRTAARSVRQEIPSFRNASMRGYATQPSAGGEGGIGNRHTIIILSALGLIGAGGYYLLKPVADVASSAKTVIDTASSGASVASSQVEDLVKSFLPPGAFALYSVVASQSGGIGGFLSNLKDKDLQGVIDEVKKAGNEDVTRIAEKVEKKVKEAKGQVSKVDWKGLIQELKTELPKDKQQMIDSLIGQIPDKADFDKYFAKAKEAGGEQLKEAEKAANKIWAQVEKAKKDGKGQANALLAGLKSSAPNDLDDLVKQVKQTAKNAGLPADAIESWLKNKADEKKIDPEHLAQQVQDKVQTAVKFLPSDPKDLVKQVEQISPSLAKLLQQALEQADAIKK